MKKLLVLLFGLTALTVVAQTNSIPTIPGVPENAVSWISLIIAGLTPVVIAGIKWIVPKIPSVALPFLAPVVGVALTQLQAFATGHPSNLVVGAIAGAVGLWLREAVDQSKQQLQPPTTPPTT